MVIFIVYFKIFKPMKKNALIVTCLIGLFLSQSCSSVKVMDSWKSDDISTIKQNNFLVVARTENTQARIAFEDEIVKQMTEKGYKATSSFSKFASLKPNEKPSEENNKKIVEMLKKEGFNGVVLTILKDYQEETRVQTDGGYYAGGTYYGYYPRYYGGFGGYYYHPMAYPTIGNYVEQTTTTSTSKLYIVETTVYDLEKEGENQLVAVVTSQIDNPESAGATAKDYVKKITQSLK
jgi:hypothetical protein